MTTTEPTTPTEFEQTVDFTERMLQSSLEEARQTFATRSVADAVKWAAEGAVQAEAKLRFMDVARRRGPQGLAYVLAREVGDTSGSPDLYTQANREQVRRAALDTLVKFRRFLDPADFLAAF